MEGWKKYRPLNESNSSKPQSGPKEENRIKRPGEVSKERSKINIDQTLNEAQNLIILGTPDSLALAKKMIIDLSEQFPKNVRIFEAGFDLALAEQNIGAAKAILGKIEKISKDLNGLKVLKGKVIELEAEIEAQTPRVSAGRIWNKMGTQGGINRIAGRVTGFKPPKPKKSQEEE